MKVQELIELLEQYDPEAEVLLAEQPTWPFEYAIHGVVSRDEVNDPDEDDEPGPITTETSHNDVFIVEGRQLRYGSKNLW